MAKVFEFLDGARADFDESFDWYAVRSEDAAIGFKTAVDAALEKIDSDSTRFPKTHGRCQYCPLTQYPFRLVFREESDRFVVVAIAHAKRRPNYWRNRIQS